MKKINYLISAICICLTTCTAVAEVIKPEEHHTRTYVRNTMNWMVLNNTQSGFSISDSNYHRPQWSIGIGRQLQNNIFMEIEYAQIGFNAKYIKEAGKFDCSTAYLGDALLFNLGKEWQVQASKNYLFVGAGVGPSLNRSKDPVLLYNNDSKVPCDTGKSIISPAGQLFVGLHHKFNEHVYIGLSARYMLLGSFGTNSECCPKTPKYTGIGSIGFEIKSYV